MGQFLFIVVWRRTDKMVGRSIKMECDVCNMEFNKTEFKKHQLIHKADSYSCDNCEAKFKHRKHLANHVKSKHELKEDDMIHGATMNPSIVQKFKENYPCPDPKDNHDFESLFKGLNNLKTPKKEVKTPRKISKTPNKETKTPKKFENLKVDNCSGCKKSFSTMAALILHMKSTTDCGKKQRNGDNLNWVKDGSRSSKPHFESDPFPKAMDINQDNQNVGKTEVKLTSFANIFSKTSFGDSKPKKIAYVKPHVKEVSGYSRGKELKLTDNKLPYMEDQPNENSTSNLNFHLLHDDDKFKCDQCGDNLKDIWELKEHFVSKHGSEDLYYEFRRKRKEKTKMLMEKARISNLSQLEGNEANEKPFLTEGNVKSISQPEEKSSTSLGNRNPREESEENSNLLDNAEDRLAVATFNCDVCEHKFRNLKSLKKHQISNHSLEKVSAINRSNTQTGDYTEMLLHGKGSDADSIMNSSFDNSNHSNLEVESENSLKKKKVACKTCKACQAEDCGVCLYCEDKPKFGGPSKLRQRCLQRICLQSGITPMKKFMLKRLEVESTKIIQKNLQDKKEKSKPVFSNKVKDDKIKDNREKEKKIKAVKEEKEKKENSQRIKPKIKLRPPVSNPDSSEKLSLKEIASQDITPTDENPKKRTNDEIDKKNDRMHKKIKIEANMAIKAKLATSEEVDELIKNEEKVGLEKSFREKLDEDLMNLIDWDTEDGYAVDLDISVPPRTPKKWW